MYNMFCIRMNKLFLAQNIRYLHSDLFYIFVFWFDHMEVTRPTCLWYKWITMDQVGVIRAIGRQARGRCFKSHSIIILMHYFNQLYVFMNLT